ncbi:MAG: phosphatase PAP2 family protein [Rhodoferax sp.]|nr:phosphatase PAP2 family protein [Rhodoferax sp.]
MIGQQRHNAHQSPARSFAIGGAVILASGIVFALLASALTAGSPLIRFDQAISDMLRASLSPLTQQVFAALTHLAGTATLTVLCLIGTLALLARHEPGLALAWVLAIAGNGWLNQGLKQMVGRVRPLDPEGSVLAQGLSFPSGHSSGAVVAYGMLAYLALRLLPKAWHLPTLFMALALAFTVGISRVVLRVHFASDVAAGFASGAAWLALCITCVTLVRWRRGQSI